MGTPDSLGGRAWVDGGRTRWKGGVGGGETDRKGSHRQRSRWALIRRTFTFSPQTGHSTKRNDKYINIEVTLTYMKFVIILIESGSIPASKSH